MTLYCLTTEDGTYRLFRNVGKKLPFFVWVQSEKSAGRFDTAVGAWNRIFENSYEFEIWYGWQHTCIVQMIYGSIEKYMGYKWAIM